MTPHKIGFHDGRMGAAITVRVFMKARANGISGVLEDGTIKVELEGATDGNFQLVSYLAEILGVDQSTLEIIAGMEGRDKLVTITGLNSEKVHELIMAHLD